MPYQHGFCLSQKKVWCRECLFLWLKKLHQFFISYVIADVNNKNNNIYFNSDSW